jgi:hypothetical protein
VRFFFDGCAPKRLAYATRVLEGRVGVEIVYKHDHPKLRRNTPDAEWIGILAAERGWVVVSFDPDILRKVHERAAWDQAGLSGFFFDGGWGNLKIDETAARFYRRWPDIKATASAVREGTTFIVPSDLRRKLIPLKDMLRKASKLKVPAASAAQ